MLIELQNKLRYGNCYIKLVNAILIVYSIVYNNFLFF